MVLPQSYHNHYTLPLHRLLPHSLPQALLSFPKPSFNMADEKSEKAPPPMEVDEENGTTRELDPTLVKHAQDADEALAVFQDLHGEVITLDESTNKRILRTIDWHIMPVMCLVYGMNFLDSLWFPRQLSKLYSNDSQRQPCLMPVSWGSKRT